MDQEGPRMVSGRTEKVGFSSTWQDVVDKKLTKNLWTSMRVAALAGRGGGLEGIGSYQKICELLVAELTKYSFFC